MDLLPLTLAIGLCLAFTLGVFFLREYVAGRTAKIAQPSVPPANRPVTES